MKRIWEKQGHEVFYENGYNPNREAERDVLWFEWCEPSIQLFSNRKFRNDQGEYDLPPLTGNLMVACRTIDIDMWAGHPGAVNWKNVNHNFIIAPHIQRLAEERFVGLKDAHSHLVRPGVELDRFPLIEKEKGKRIAWVGNNDDVKGIGKVIALFVAISRKEKGWTLHLRNQDFTGSYIYYYYRNLLEYDGLWDKMEMVTDRVENMSDFYANKDYIVSYSSKEAFSYSTAEGMATGLKPVIHRFYVADEVWDSKYIFTTEEEAINMIMGDNYEPKEYRKYIEDHHDAERMVKEYNDILGIK